MQRNAEILKIIEEYTARASVTKKAARETLIAEGIYTRRGKLRAAFGGGKKAAARA